MKTMALSIVASLFFLNSCGDSFSGSKAPSNSISSSSSNSSSGDSSFAPLTSRDLTKLQREENAALHSDELIPILGTYSGVPDEGSGLYLKREDRWVKFELFLTMHTQAIEDEMSVDSIILPQLSGSAKQWLEGSHTYIELEIESGTYNPRTRKIYLTFKNTSLSLEGFLGNDGIHANWNSSLRGDIAGVVHLQKSPHKALLQEKTNN